MAAPYIPTADAAVDAWSQNFSTKITAAPTTYGLVAGDATTIAAVVLAFHNAYLIAGVSGTPPKTPLNPSLRTPVSIAAKDTARDAMLVVLRLYAITIRNNPGVADADKTALGLTIVKTIPTPIPAPVTFPLLDIVAATPGQVTFSARDSGTPSVKAKPFGAIQLQAFVVYSETTPPAPGLSNYIGDFTKSPFVASFAADDAGKTAYLSCRWQTRKGLVGPWSAALPFTVPLGGS